MLRKELPKDNLDSRLTGYRLNGMEVILSKKRGPRYKIRNPNYFNLEQKTDACALYCVYGDLDEVSKLTDIPVKHLRVWKDEPWWAEIQRKVFVEQNERLASRISQVLDTSLDQLVERLQNGDYIWDVRNSKLARKPVDTKVLSGLFNNLVHRRQLVRGEPTSISSNLAVDDRLKLLSEQFSKFSKAKEITYEEVEYTIEGPSTEEDGHVEAGSPGVRGEGYGNESKEAQG